MCAVLSTCVVQVSTSLSSSCLVSVVLSTSVYQVSTSMSTSCLP